MDDGLQPAYPWCVGQQPGLQLHLLTGKISQPGCGPFSLTGSLPRVVLRVKWAPLLTVCLRHGGD